jgi:DNA helicase HerA-like ATPase
MCRGRKRGLAGVIATQRLAKLAKNVAAEASNFLMGRTFLDIDMARAADLLGMDRRQAEQFRDLARGHFVALGPAVSRRPLPIVIGPVETSARSTSPKLTPLPEAPVDAADLIFTMDPDEIARPVVRRPAPPPPPSTNELLAQVARARAEREPEPTSLFPEIDEAEREETIKSVMIELMSDPDAGFRNTAQLYQDFLVRCRIRRVPGEPPALPAFKRLLAVARVAPDEETASSDGWQQALTLSETLTDDVQGVFLVLAQAALTGGPCPSDATIARLYGTHSTSRARRLLTWFEERGLIVIRTDFRNQRIAAFPDLGVETAPGDPNGPDVIAEERGAAE